MRSTRGINVGEPPGLIGKLSMESDCVTERILINNLLIKKRTFPNCYEAPRSANRRTEFKLIKGSAAEATDVGIIKGLFFCLLDTYDITFRVRDVIS
jgi:hypothetical protein